MTRRITFIAVAGVAMLALTASTALAQSEPQKRGLSDFGLSFEQVGVPPTNRISDASDRAGPSQFAPYPDAIDRAVAARLAAQTNVSRYPDAVERAVARQIQSGSLVGHIDRYELDLPKGPVAAPTPGAGREIEWPQIGIGFGTGILLALGLFLAMRMTRARELAH